MPRGGAREGAGRKTQWVSGCSFSETTVIRIPRIIKEQVLEIAHRLDAGERIDLVSNSIQGRNQYLENRVVSLEKELSRSQQELAEKIELLNNSRREPKQLELNLDSDPNVLENLKKNVLKALQMGSQSKAYKRVEKTLEKEIEKIK